MSIFQEVGLTWKGIEYTVPADKVMGLIEVIEDVLTLEELGGTNGIRRAKVSKAFAVALRYAGANGVSQQEVYNNFFDPTKAVEIQTIITSLLMMMIPPEHLQESTAKKKTTPRKPAKRRTATAKGS